MVGQKVSKKKRCGPLSLRAFELFHKYLRVGLKPGPSETELDAVGFHDGGGRRSRFKRWAKKLAIRPSDGMLILQQNGKLIVPKEWMGSLILRMHTLSGKPGHQHIGLNATINKVTSSEQST